MYGQTDENMEHPNILVVLVDDLRWDELGCAGHPFARTPQIDRIAFEGVRFRNAFVTTPVSSPSRASFLTGQYAHNNNVIDPLRPRKFLPAERHKDWYTDAPIPRRLNVTDVLQGKPALQRKIDDLPLFGPETGTIDEKIRDRQRMLVAIDEGVGQIMDALEEIGQLDETVFVFTSDQGYWYGEHGLSRQRRLAYEESIRIPMLVRYPKQIKPGYLADEMVMNIDLAPTLLELAGFKPPKSMDGYSFVSLLQRTLPEDWRTSLLIQYFTESPIVFPRMRNMGYKALRTERYKYIRYTDLDGMDELYDLKSDPYEMKNIINDPGVQITLWELEEELERLLNGV